MHAEILTPPAGPALNLDEARDFLRLSGTQDDRLLTRLIAAAEARVEAETGLVLMPRRLRAHLGFSRPALAGPGLRLTPGPVQKVEAVALRDGPDLSNSLRWSGHRLRLAPGGSGAALPARGDIEVIWTAGFATLPGDLSFAVTRLVAEGFVRRGLPGDRDPAKGLPEDVAEILAHYARVRL